MRKATVKVEHGEVFINLREFAAELEDDVKHLSGHPAFSKVQPGMEAVIHSLLNIYNEQRDMRQVPSTGMYL